MFYQTAQGKNTLKRFVSIFITILLASTALTSNIKAAPSTTVFSQNFDEEPTGSIPQGWIVGDPSVCSLTVNDTIYHGDSGKSAKFEDPTHLPFAHVIREFENQYGSLTFSFAVMIEVADYFDIYIHDDYYADSDQHGANVYFLSNGYIAYYDDASWHYLCPFSLGTWYEIRMAIDIPTNTYDIYVDNSLKARGVHFRGFGKALYLGRIELGGQSYPTPVGYIDDMSLVVQEHVAPISPIVELVGGLDYLLAEDVQVRLDALVIDNNTMIPVSNASVIIRIYYPNGSLWISDSMMEILPSTGIYEWESNGTINQLNLEKGVYLVYIQALVGENPASADITSFHIDPAPAPGADLLPFSLLASLIMVAVGGTITGTVLSRRHKKRTVENL